MNTEKLLSTINSRGGLISLNRYSVTFGNISSVISGDDLSTLCLSVILPGINLNGKDYQTVRNAYRVPSGYSLSEVRMVFRATKDMSVRKFFESWMELCVNRETYRIGYESDYASNIEIAVRDKENESAYHIKLLSAWPQQITDVTLSDDNPNEFMTIEVSFAYRDLELISMVTPLISDLPNTFTSFTPIA